MEGLGERLFFAWTLWLLCIVFSALNGVFLNAVYGRNRRESERESDADDDYDLDDSFIDDDGGEEEQDSDQARFFNIT